MNHDIPNDDSVGVSVHAGFPNPADDRSHGSLDFNQLLIQHPVSTFMFAVEGGEWEALGMFAGDVAVVDRALSARQTDIIIWWRGSEFAISNLSRLPHDAQVWGVVTAVIHRFRKADV